MGSTKTNKQVTVSESIEALQTKVNSTIQSVAERVKQAEIQEVQVYDNKGKQVAYKVYQLSNPIGNKNTLQIMDTDTIIRIERIIYAIRARSVMGYVICKELQKLEDEKKYESTGFKNIAEMGNALFGLQQSTVNQYVRIARAFINDDYTVKKPFPALPISHFLECLKLLDEDGNTDAVQELFLDGTLRDGMTTKAIRETIKKKLDANIIDIPSVQIQLQSGGNNESTAEVTASQLANTEIENTTDEIEAELDGKVVLAKILNYIQQIKSGLSILGIEETPLIGELEDYINDMVNAG